MKNSKNIYLKDAFPQIFSKINIELTKKDYPNINLDKITTGSHLKMWFTCEKGHNFQKFVFNLCNGNPNNILCPECNPEWNYKSLYHKNLIIYYC